MKNEDSKSIDDILKNYPFKFKNRDIWNILTNSSCRNEVAMFSIGDEVTVIKDVRGINNINRTGQKGNIVDKYEDINSTYMKQCMPREYFANCKMPVYIIDFFPHGRGEFSCSDIQLINSTKSTAAPEPTCTCQSLLWGHSRECAYFKPSR